MKIVQTDNFVRETVADVLIAENVPSKRLGDVMVEALNKAFSGDHSPVYYKLKEDSYELFKPDY